MTDADRRQYRTFDLRIFRAVPGQAYPVSVLDSPAGQCDAEFRLPYEVVELDELVGNMTEGRMADAEAQAFGERLFAALFGETVGLLWEASLGTDRDRGLRLRLRIDPPELQQLPWEFLYDPRRRVYLSADPATPVVRFLSLPVPVETLETPAPLHILVASATPQGLNPLGVEREQLLIQASLAPLIERGQVALTFLPHATVSSLSQGTRAGAHVLHFIGHGVMADDSGTGWLLLETETGAPAPVSGAQLGDILRGTDVRLVVLNACETARSSRDALFGVAPQLVASGLPAVIANQFPISDQAAQAIAREFYAAVADNLPVDAALAEARKIVRAGEGQSTSDWGPPVLFMRSPDGRILDLRRPRPGLWAGLPRWAKWMGAVVAALLVLALSTTLLLNVRQIAPTSTPDRLPLITTPQATGEYLVLVADFKGQEQFQIGRRISNRLAEAARPASGSGKLRVEWRPDLVISTAEEAQEWGRKHDATAVIWGWSDGAGFNSYFRLISARHVPVSGLPEQAFADPQIINQYVRSELPEAATYLALLGTGLAAAYQGDAASALSLLGRAEAIWPTVGPKEQASLAEKYAGLGYLYWFRGWTYANAYDPPDLKQAATEYRRALTMSGAHLPLSHYNLAQTYKKLGDPRAVEHLQAFVQQPPPDFAYLLPPAYRQLGNALGLAGRTEEANAAWDKAAQLNPQDPRVPLSRGWYAYRRGDLVAAEAYYKQAQALDSKYCWPYFNLALVYLIRNDAAAAKQAYQTALRLVSESASADAEQPPAQVLDEALGDLDQLIAEHPDLGGPSTPLRQTLVEAMRQANK